MSQVLPHGSTFRGRGSAETAIERLIGGFEHGRDQRHEMEKLASKNKSEQALAAQKFLRDLQLKQKEYELKEHLEGFKQSEKFKQKKSFLDEILGKGKKSSTGTKENREQEDVEETQPSQFSNEEIIGTTAVDPSIGRVISHLHDIDVREAREKTKSKERKAAAMRAETLPIRKDLADKAASAQQGIENKERLIDLIKSGKINDPTYAALAEALPLNLGQRLLSPETVQYKAGIIEEFKDLRNIFQGQTRIKEIDLLEKKVADIYLTDEQKEAILKSRMNALKAEIIRAEAAADLEKEGKDYGVLQFRQEVDKRAKPKLEALFNKVLDEQKSIIQSAENRKNIPLDPSDPEDMQIAQQIMIEAGNDRKKARELAKKKGYVF